MNLEDIYFKLPIAMQNVAVSLKGLQLNRTRTSGNYRRYRSEIYSRTGWERSQLEKYAFSELNKLVERVCRESSFYSELYSRETSGNFAIDSMVDLRRLPVLTKEMVRANAGAMICQDVKSTISVKTTGTTGTPLKVVCSHDDRQLNYAFFDNFLASNGLDAQRKHVVLGGRLVSHPEAGFPYWRVSRFQNALLMSSYHLSKKNLPAYIAKLQEFRPEWIEAYPSSIYLLASEMLVLDIKIALKGVVTSAETLSIDQREVIESAFECKVYDQYGCAEMAVFSAQCSFGSYHIRPDYAIVEILDDAWEPVADGMMGNIVCTSLVNRTMPFIRYAIGDVGCLSLESCPCGLDTPVLGSIQGRKDDVIYTADGTPIGRLSPVLKGFPIVAAQYFQKKIGDLEVHVVPTEAFTAESSMQIVSALRKRVGQKMQIDIKIVKELKRGPGGKVKSVISLIKQH